MAKKDHSVELGDVRYENEAAHGQPDWSCDKSPSVPELAAPLHLDDQEATCQEVMGVQRYCIVSIDSLTVQSTNKMQSDVDPA